MLSDFIQPPQAVVFDMDGTLLDSMAFWKKLPIRYLVSRGIAYEDSLKSRLYPLSLDWQIQILRDELHISDAPEEILSSFHADMEYLYRTEVQVKPGTVEFLAVLKQHGIPLHLFSATPLRMVRIALESTGLISFFDTISSTYDQNTSKHDLAAFSDIRQRIGCPFENIWVFEDALYAIRTAKSAGMRVVAISDPTAAADIEEICATADLYLPSLEDASALSLLRYSGLGEPASH